VEDYAEYYSQAREPFPTAEDHPYLLSVTKLEVALSSMAWIMFNCGAPKLCLSDRQKRVFLLAALNDHSNKYLAARLGISGASVRYCFRAGHEEMKDCPSTEWNWKTPAGENWWMLARTGTNSLEFSARIRRKSGLGGAGIRCFITTVFISADFTQQLRGPAPHPSRGCLSSMIRVARGNPR